MSLINKMLRDIDQRSSADQENKSPLIHQVRPVKGGASNPARFMVLGILGASSLGVAAYYLSDQILKPVLQSDSSPASPVSISPAVPPTQSAPAAAPAAAVVASADVASNAAEQEITSLTRDWAAAWSAKNFIAYIGFYSDQFSPAGSMSRDQWAESRRVRIARPTAISVELSNIAVEKLSDNQFAVRFNQRYTSDNFSETLGKTLIWQRSNNDWKIVREDVNQAVIAAVPKESAPLQRTPPPRELTLPKPAPAQPPVKLAMQSAPQEVPLVIAASSAEKPAPKLRSVTANADAAVGNARVLPISAEPPNQPPPAVAPQPSKQPEAGTFSITRSAPPPPAAPTTIVQNEVPGVSKILSPNQQSDNLFRQARALMQQGRVDEARSQLESALQASPQNHQARQLLGQLLLDIRLLDEAERLLTEGLLAAPRHQGMLITLAHTQLQKDNPDLAINTLLREESSARANADYQALLAAMLQRRNRHPEAMEHYLNAVRLSPNNANWLVGLGISLQAQNITVGATEAFERALELGTLSPALIEAAKQRLAQLKKNQPARPAQ